MKKKPPSSIHVFLFSSLTLLCSIAHSELSQEDLATVGSYSFFVALDTRCGKPSKERTDSLAEYKKLFLFAMRTQYDYARKDQHLLEIDLEKVTAGEQMLARMEKNGPDEVELKKANRIFDQLNSKEIKDLCKSFSADVGQKLKSIQFLFNNAMEIHKMLEQVKKNEGIAD